MRVLIPGGNGMLGHKLAQVLAAEHEVAVALRNPAVWPAALPVAARHALPDARDTAGLARMLDAARPEVVLNAAGVIKQVSTAPAEMVAGNALLPNTLSELCAERGIRLLQYSTDCVFSGAADSRRGPAGYRETDPPDARDTYGLSKLLGEPQGPTTLVLRTSIIGRELRGRRSLVEWFLAQDGAVADGYTRALFTGLPTLELARVTALLLRDHPGMTGLWHVAAEPISKHALLTLVGAAFRRRTELRRQDAVFCDRRLDGTRFREATGWRAAPWPDLVAAMAADPFDYAGAMQAAAGQGYKA